MGYGFELKKKTKKKKKIENENGTTKLSFKNKDFVKESNIECLKLWQPLRGN